MDDPNQPVPYHWSLSYLCTHCDETFDEEAKVEQHLLTHSNYDGYFYEGGGGGGGEVGAGASGSSIDYDDMSDCIVLD